MFATLFVGLPILGFLVHRLEAGKALIQKVMSDYRFWASLSIVGVRSCSPRSPGRSSI
jgi:hypothetical protein